jgi:hypothetical protein
MVTGDAQFLRSRALPGLQPLQQLDIDGRFF